VQTFLAKNNRAEFRKAIKDNNDLAAVGAEDRTPDDEKGFACHL
jgi:hypothetical protein